MIYNRDLTRFVSGTKCLLYPLPFVHESTTWTTLSSFCDFYCTQSTSTCKSIFMERSIARNWIPETEELRNVRSSIRARIVHPFVLLDGRWIYDHFDWCEPFFIFVIFGTIETSIQPFYTVLKGRGIQGIQVYFKRRGHPWSLWKEHWISLIFL